MTAPSIQVGDVFVWTTPVLKIQHRATVTKIEGNNVHVVRGPHDSPAVVPMYVSKPSDGPSIADYLTCDEVTVERKGVQIHPPAVAGRGRK